jgi:hypothetical protein
LLILLSFRATKEKLGDDDKDNKNDSNKHIDMSDIMKKLIFFLRIFLGWTLLQVRIAAGSLAGLHYSLCTFTQLLRLSGGEPGSSVLVPVQIQDQPAIRHRAVLLDISPQGRVPAPVSLYDAVKLVN